MRFVVDDGGRAAAGFKGRTGDCVARAIAIATGKPYAEVYAEINAFAARERPRGRKTRSSARDGVSKPTIRKYMTSLGWVWHPTMQIGQGCTVHLHAKELPRGRLVVAVSKHLTAVIDGVIHDTHDPQRDAHVVEPDRGQALKEGQWRNPNGICSIQRRCVYGYWTAPSPLRRDP